MPAILATLHGMLVALPLHYDAVVCVPGEEAAAQQGFLCNRIYTTNLIEHHLVPCLVGRYTPQKPVPVQRGYSTTLGSTYSTWQNT